MKKKEEHPLQRIWDNAIPIDIPCLKKGYIFKIGKHKGKSVEDVEKVDNQYIVWFEMNIPIEQW